MKRILFEVDAGPTIGMGHLSRCKVLARALTALGLAPMFNAHGLPAGEHIAPFAPYDGQSKADAVVIDRYTASVEEIAALRARHGLLLILDDHADRPVPADIILNGNYYAQGLDYTAFGPGLRLLGPYYAPVTEDFVALRNAPWIENEVLLTFGLSRLSGLLPPLAAALAEALPEIRLRAIVPAAYRAPIALPDRVTLIDPAPLAQLVAPSSLIVCGLGVSWLEMIASGRLVAGTRLVDNQDLMLDALRREHMPVAAEPSAQAILAAIENARTGGEALFAPLRAVLDGRGPERVARELAALIP